MGFQHEGKKRECRDLEVGPVGGKGGERQKMEVRKRVREKEKKEEKKKEKDRRGKREIGKRKI